MRHPDGYQYKEVDEKASKYALPATLWIPVAAVSVEAIRKYVGDPEQGSQRDPSKALVVTTPGVGQFPFDDLPVWDLPFAERLHSQKQLWVHIDYTGYRRFYRSEFPDVDGTDIVVDHICNRRFARQLGYEYIRLIDVSRGANSSSGRGPESEGVKFLDSDAGVKTAQRAKTPIQYADTVDIAKMLNIKTGGFPLNAVRDLHKYLEPNRTKP